MTDGIRKLGRYELIRRLATGGMGEIYLARTRGAGGFEKMVIIKTILPHLAEEEEFVTKFLDEGRIVVQLTHGNIVPVFDMGEEDGEYFIAMEYVPGLDLRAVLKRLSARGEELPIAHALYITCELCKGLGYAHRKVDSDGNPLHIVHRDVSPSNVLISREGEVKIIDFGIARAADKVAKTATGRIQGKCSYMSPEQARGKALDARSDIFSTGVLLYEMLTLTRPFEGRSDLASLELVRECDADPPGVLRPEIPDEVDNIVGKAMAPDPDDRYPTIDDMFVALQEEIYRLGTTVTSQRLSNELSEVFADEEAGDIDDDDSPPANLDEALERELARLGEAPETPADSGGAALGLAQTATSASSGTRTLGPGHTPTTADERPNSSKNNIDTGKTSPTGQTRPTGQTSPTNPELEQSTTRDTPSPVRRRHLVITAIFVAIIVGIVGIAIVYVLQPIDDATLQLITDPEGAQIHLDGDELAGYRTPETLTLAPDSYRIELTLDGHRPRQFRVDLSAGEQVVLDEHDLQLIPEHEPPREFRVTTNPPGATLVADGESLGSAPREVSVEPDDVVNLSARAPGCSTIYYTLSHGHRRQNIHLTLQCEDADEGDESQDSAAELRAQRDDYRLEQRGDIAPRGPRRHSVRIESTPPGADITVNDELIGQSPIYADLDPRQETLIKADLDGYKTYELTAAAGELDDELHISLEELPQGCLNFRAVYPANNEIAINDQWLDGRHMTLENHRLPAGDHSITVRHPESDKEESFDIGIEPGDDCKVLTVWERQ